MDSDTRDFVDRLRLDVDPVADSAATVVVGSARFTVLTDRLLRLEWSADAVFEDRGSYAFPHRRGPVPSFTTDRDGPAVTIETGALTLRYEPDDQPFHQGNLRITLDGAAWTPGQVDPHNLGGARRTVDGCRGEARLETGLVSRSGWALHDDSTGPLFGDDGWVLPRGAHGDRQDWYFFGYGHDYAGAIGDYTKFGGAVPLMPRWLLGAWWSRYWPYRDSDLRELVTEFESRNFPLDVLVVDMDWHRPGSWTGYSWNRELFPQPREFLAWLHDRGLHTTLNLHPAQGVQSFEDAYPEFARAMGVEPATGETVPFQVADRDYMRHYFELLHHPLEDDGVDFWWMDWQQGRLATGGVDPLPWLNHVHFQDLRRHDDRRPLDFSRWGGLGSHRYPVGFSGDSFATWDALAFQPRYTAAGANVAYGWWSHDIGGHVGPDDPELYVRWVQFGALSPVLRLHSTQDPLAERRPWTFGAAETEAARAAFYLRYQLIPYLYTAARVASDTGVAPVRPMSWVAPDEDAAYAAREQYLLGPDLLVAPVVTPADPATGLAEVDVWLPAGDWIERSGGEKFTGPRWVRRSCALTDVPQFVRAGAVLPLADVAPTVARQPDDHLTLSVFPGAGAARLYDDDGTSLAFESGEFAWTDFVLNADQQRCAVSIAGGPPRRWTVRFEHVDDPAGASVDGAACAWTRDGDAVVVEAPAGSAVVELSGAIVRAAEDEPMAPLIHVWEYRAPDDAASQLGRVLVAGDDVTASLRWTYEGRDGVRSIEVEPTAVTRAGVLFDAPWAWDGTLAPARWSVDVRAAAGDGATVTRTHVAQTLIPSFASWRVAMWPAGQAPALADVTAETGIDWQEWRDDPFDLDYAELGQRCEVAPEVADAWVGTPGVVDATTTLQVATGCEVAFDYWADDEDVTVRVDGRPLGPDVSGNPASAKWQLVRSARRTPAVWLDAGEHRLDVRCDKTGDLPWGIWGLSVAAVDPATGEIVLGVRAE